MARASEPVIADIGYTFDPAYQGRGYATEAVGELVRYLFEDRGKHKVSADATSRNDGSWRLLERLGFRARPSCEGRSGTATAGATSTCTGCSPTSGANGLQ